jgi:hypothetical protein
VRACSTPLQTSLPLASTAPRRVISCRLSKQSGPSAPNASLSTRTPAKPGFLRPAAGPAPQILMLSVTWRANGAKPEPIGLAAAAAPAHNTSGRYCKPASLIFHKHTMCGGRQLHRGRSSPTK